MIVTRPALSVADSATIDGLRGMAALIVVASHASNLGLHLVPGLSLAGTGKYGVYLFFVISAFLLTLQWLQAPPGGPGTGAALGRYLVRRVLRIYPLYAAVLLLGWLLPRGLGVPMDGAAVWTHLTLHEGRDLYWSVPVEFKYYLVIPLVAWMLSTPWPTPWKVLLVALLIAAAMFTNPPAQAAVNSIELGDYMPIFLCGSALAWAWAVGGVGVSSARGPGRFVCDLLLLGLLAATVPAVLQALGWKVPADLLHRQFLAWGVFWSLVLMLVLRGWLPACAAMLRWRALQACGRWCFGIYLLHMPALYLAKRLPGPESGRAWVGLVLALAVAAVAHALIERPAMRWACAVTRKTTG